MGRNRTVPHAVSAADRPRALQTTSTHNVDRRQHAKQYWPIRRASNNSCWIL